MKAMVYYGPGKRAWEDVPDPVIKDPRDIIVKTEVTTICGTDLHILKGDVPEMPEGTILGHEAVGVVTEVGSAVKKHKVGDRVLVSCITGCGHCTYCAKGMYAHCLDGGGWILGHLIDGTQAEYIRVPYADVSAYAIPDNVTSEDALMLSDILATGYEIGTLNGRVAKDDIVAVVGAGPVGLAAIATSAVLEPRKIIAIDLDPNRLERAKDFGATHGVLASDHDAVEQVRALSEGLGVDVSMEAVGIPATWNMALDILRPGGRLANLGVHGTAVDFHIEHWWIFNITITTGLVSASTTPDLMARLAAGELPARQMITHRFQGLDKFDEAYTVFGNAAENKALKVVLQA